MAEIFVPIFFFLTIAVVVVGPRYLQSQERLKMHDTLRAAIDKGQPLPPEVIEAISRDVRPQPSPARDLRRGVVLLAVGVGIAVGGLIMCGEQRHWGAHIIGIAAIPAFLGVAFIAMGLIGRNRT